MGRPCMVKTEQTERHRQVQHETSLAAARAAYLESRDAPPVTQAQLKQILDYNEFTGVFTYRETRGRFRAGQVAGSPDVQGRATIVINRRQYPATRLAWLYMTGEWPRYKIKFRDGDRTNTAWANLQESQVKMPSEDCRPPPNGLWGCWGKPNTTNEPPKVGSI